MPGGPVFWQLYQSCISLVVTWSLFFSVFDLQWFIFFYEIRPSRIIRKSKAQLWSWYSSSVIQKIWLHFILGHKTFFNLSFACDWLPLKSSTLPAHRLAAQPSASVLLMKPVFLWGPRRRHLHTGLISLRKKLWPLWWHPQAKSQSRLVISSTPGS